MNFMETVSVGTTQNISINYTMAGLFERIMAFLVDVIIVIAYGFTYSLILGSVFNEPPLSILIIGGIVAYLYFLVAEIFMDGQTIGKRSQNLKVVKLDGSKPGISAYLLRWVMLPIDLSLGGGIAIVLIIFTRHGQRLGDLLAGTTVVKLRKNDFTLKRKRQLMDQVDESYEPVFTEAARMSDADLRLIQRAIAAFRNSGARQPMELLKTRMEEKLEVKSDMPPIKFLHTLTKDYTYFATRGE